MSIGPAISAFQKKIRGEETELRDHICKEMNALNLERCRCIPKEQPGADWRVLQTIVEEDPSREKYQVNIKQFCAAVQCKMLLNLIPKRELRMNAYTSSTGIAKMDLPAIENQRRYLDLPPSDSKFVLLDAVSSGIQYLSPTSKKKLGLEQRLRCDAGSASGALVLAKHSGET